MAACGSICSEQVVEVARCSSFSGCKRVGDDVRDREERQPSREERRDSDFVRRVECTGICPALLAGSLTVLLPAQSPALELIALAFFAVRNDVATRHYEGFAFHGHALTRAAQHISPVAPHGV